MIQTTECTFKSARACNCSTCALLREAHQNPDDFVDPNFYENAYDNPLIELSDQDLFHSKTKGLRNKTKKHSLEFWQSAGARSGFSLFLLCLLFFFCKLL
jgi:hypothetical protein